MPALLLLLALPAWAGFDHTHASWGRVLKTFSSDGRVDYAALKKSPVELKSYLAEVSAVRESDYAAWSEPEKIAFWLNAYNAATVKVVIDHYPIKPRLGASLLYPKNSIRQIPGVWDRKRFAAKGRKLTLDEMEHKVLRKDFAEARIHLALVCASLGCPLLRGEPYVGPRLELQLEDQTRRFLGDPAKFRIDREARTVWLSPIFKWFGADFIARYGPREGFGSRKPAEKAALSFISRYLVGADADFLAAGAFTVKYLDYDWSLNEK